MILQIRLKVITNPVSYFITDPVDFNYKCCFYYISGWILLQIDPVDITNPVVYCKSEWYCEHNLSKLLVIPKSVL